MKLNFSRGLTGISIMLKLQLSVTAGLGIKGVASISITGYGYLSLSIRWTLQSLTPAVTLSFGAGLYLAVQIVLFKHQISLLEMKPEKILWENDVARAMIKAAGLGVGVANTIESMKPECDVITERDCDHGAVAEVIEKYVFNAKE